MAMCPRCFQEKPLLADKCPHCTADVPIRQQANHSLMTTVFFYGAIIVGLLWFF